MKVGRCVQVYVERKQACGYSYVSIARLLRAFARFVGNVQISLIEDHHLDAFLGRGKMSNNTWRHHSACLAQFFRYWFARGQLLQLPMAKLKPAQTKTFFPYIFSREEIRKLLDATSIGQRAPRCVLGTETLKTILLFLYGTAVKIDDALALLYSDVDFTNSCVQIQSATVHQRRMIPIGSDVKQLLQRYVKTDERSPFGPKGALFVTVKGKPVLHNGLSEAFRRLRKLTGIKRTNSLFQPRLQDLRHSFAVHSIESWIRKGHALPKMLPMLATYMGKVDVQGMERYLELSPCSYEAQLELLKFLAPLSEGVAPVDP